MNVLSFKNLSKNKILLFVFKNKKYFGLHNTEKHIRLQWKKLHSRTQARYRGYELFNRLPVTLRNEQKLSSFKRGLRDIALDRL